MQHLNENDFYKSSDMPLVATLLCYDYSIDSVDKSDSKAIFYILRDSALDSFIEQYYARKLMVEPMGYFYAIKEVKTRLYN